MTPHSKIFVRGTQVVTLDGHWFTADPVDTNGEVIVLVTMTTMMMMMMMMTMMHKSDESRIANSGVLCVFMIERLSALSGHLQVAECKCAPAWSTYINLLV